MRITKKERQENARQFYQSLQNNGEGAIVIERRESSSNPYINRTHFKAVCSVLRDTPKVIAESPALGAEGCFIEMLEAIKPGPQKCLHEIGFDAFLKAEYHLAITYDDGMVMMIEYKG